MARRGTRPGESVTGAAGRTRRQRCVTCRPSEWRAIKARARAEGVDVSAYILSRVLDGEAPDGPPHPEAGYPMALTGAEQRRQLDVLDRSVASCGPLTQAPFVVGTGATIGRAMNFLGFSLDPDWRRSEDLPLGGRHALRKAGSGPEPEPGTRAAAVPDGAKAADGASRQPDLFDGPDAGAASAEGPERSGDP